MKIYAVIADLTASEHWLNWNLLLSVAAGVVGGLGVVGLVHFILRPRFAAAPPSKEERPPDPFVHGSKSEHRKSFRRGGNPITILYTDHTTNGKPLEAVVLNRSVGGLCIQTDRPVVPETQLSVRPSNAPHIAPWVQVVVKNCREADIGYEVGCQFVKTPPWPVLMMFG